MWKEAWERERRRRWRKEAAFKATEKLNLFWMICLHLVVAVHPQLLRKWGDEKKKGRCWRVRGFNRWFLALLVHKSSYNNGVLLATLDDASFKAPTHRMCCANERRRNAKCLDTKRLDESSSRRPWHVFATKTCENKFTKTFLARGHKHVIFPCFPRKKEEVLATLPPTK